MPRLVLSLGILPVVSGFWAAADFPGWYFSLRNAHVVDLAGKNLLMRTGNPAVYSVHGPAISYSALEQALTRAAGSLFPAGPVDFVDVTLLGEKEARIVNVEHEGFGSNLVSWPLTGVRPDSFSAACDIRGLSCPASMQPAELAPHARQRLAADFVHWDTDDLDRRVVELRQILEAPGKNGAPRVVFFHCLCGCDRTGELSAAYAMRYRNMSLTQALAENELVAGRHMYYNFQVASHWYCESLRARGLYAHDDAGIAALSAARTQEFPSTPSSRTSLPAWDLSSSLPSAVLEYGGAGSVTEVRVTLKSDVRAIAERMKWLPQVHAHDIEHACLPV
eukprot:CAMPEP_0175367364 /NCGR_PEP_ID=MMETSP0095-20121207/19625_1 /TAXON_ID=311494 /ORGANISM="Alexandrium monilatum, Strain CCMP3105" /LENGTH=334 /DNA_ID=CAMNT_0016665421 /DNA_START=37 /DNA_END=1040 /DNA_ORIENTATION=+